MQKNLKSKSIKTIPGVTITFSPKRALGIPQAKRKFAKITGIPTSQAGLERKIGKIIIKFITNILLGLFSNKNNK